MVQISGAKVQHKPNFGGGFHCLQALLLIWTTLLAFAVSADPLVWKDEYIVTSKGISAAGSLNGLGKKFEIKERAGQSLLLKLKSHALHAYSNNGIRSLKKYNPKKDRCQDVPAELYACSPNYFIKATSSNLLWGIGAPPGINAVEAWPVSTGKGNIVAVLDTGIELTHYDLKPNLWINPHETKDGIDNDNNGCIDDIWGCNFADAGDPMDRNGHGTHVAGTIAAAANGQGVTGVAHESKLIAVKMLNDSGGGSVFSAIKGIKYVTALKKAGHPIVSINASWGSYGYSEPLRLAISAAGKQDLLVIAAAGNNGLNNDHNPHYPGSYRLSNIIAVGAINKTGKLATFSNYGSGSVNVFAPGVGILSTYTQGRINYLSGTSMAAPHVSGLSALLQGNAAERRFRILNTASKKENLAEKCSTGAIADARGAVSGAFPVQCQKKKCVRCNAACKVKSKKRKKRRQCRAGCRATYHCKPGKCRI